MSSALTVQTVQDERSYTATHRIPGPPVLRPLDVRRMIEHLVTEVTHELLRIEHTDPSGLIITVNDERLPDGSTTYVVSGSLPQESELGAE